MAYSQFTGDDMIFTWDSITLTGLQEVTMTSTGAEPARKLDDTVAGDSAYSEMADPLGGQGDDKTTVTTTQLVSRLDFNETGILTKAMGAAGTTLFQPDGATGGSVEWNGTSVYLQRREYTIDLAERATLTCTFEVNDAGTWASV